MTAEQLRAARGMLRWSQQELAERSGISVPTIKRLEAMTGELAGHTATTKAIQTAIEAAGIELIGAEGVRLGKSA